MSLFADNGRQTPWRLMVRVCLLDADAFGHPGQYQELAVEVSEPFQVSTFCMYTASLKLV